MRDAAATQDAGLEGRTVLQVLPALSDERKSRLVLAIATALTAAGARVLVAAEKGRLIGDLQAAGGEWIPLAARSTGPISLMRNAASLSGLIGRERVDLVHAHGRAPAWSAYAAARTARRPLATSFHHPTDRNSRLLAFADWPLGRGDAVLAPSAFVAGRIGDRHGTRADCLAVVSPGLDLSAFDPQRVAGESRAGFRLAAGLAGPDRMVLLQARLDPGKGQIVLIDAVRLLVNGGLTDTVFAIVMEGPDRPDYRAVLEQRIRAQGLEGIVRLVGPAHAGAAPLASAHLAIVPSTVPEPVGRNAIEAIAMGIPVIVSDEGALPEVVPAPPGIADADRVGFHARPGDPLALAVAIGEALALKPGRHERIGRQARAHAGRFSLARMQADVLGVYQRLLGAGD
jgi:glycosyltransferase involved in cell wall biosynthesis